MPKSDGVTLLGQGIERALQERNGKFYSFFHRRDPKLHRHFQFLSRLASELQEGGINPYTYGYVVTRRFLELFPQKRFYVGFLGTNLALSLYFNRVNITKSSEEDYIGSFWSYVTKVARGWRVSVAEALDILEAGGRLSKEVRKRIERYIDFRRRAAE